MFTGLVWAKGAIVAYHQRAENAILLEISASGKRFANIGIGDSVSVNGCCLTVVQKKLDAITYEYRFAFELSPETMTHTTFGELQVGDAVNLEAALSLQTPLGGHLVSGHVDAMADVLDVIEAGEYTKILFTLEGAARNRVAPFLVSKGSVTVDGVSLTVNAVNDDQDKTCFEVMIIPHTADVTVIGDYEIGDRVNVEADIAAKYVNRYQDYFNRYAQPQEGSSLELSVDS